MSEHIKYHWDVMQGSDEWYHLRLGILTSSEMPKIISPKLKLADNKDSRAIIFEKAYDRLFRYIDPNFESYDMQRGNVEEVYARDLYIEKYAPVKECGFVVNTAHGFPIGYSPDGIVGIEDGGLIEVKSRKGHLQVKSIFENVCPDEYMIQIQTGLLVTERKWCDFLSYSNGMHMQKVRVNADEKIQEKIIEAAQNANKRIEAVIDKYNENVKAHGFVIAPRRDMDSGDEIKPSAEYDASEILAAG